MVNIGPSGTAEPPSSISDSSEHNQPTGSIVLSCNILSRNENTASNQPGESSSQSSYTLIATVLQGDAAALPVDEDIQLAPEPPKMEFADPPPPYEATPRRDSSATNMIEKTPKSSTHINATESFSESHTSNQLSPRIEDSLAELDDLEDELEAINQVTSSGAMPSAKRQPKLLPSVNAKQGSASPNRNSMSATARLKVSTSDQKTVRRASSLTLRDKTDRKAERCETPIQRKTTSASATKSTGGRTNGGLVTAKSTKPLTKPDFELPGEAVARRLKEQREARMAQQAEEKKAATVPTRLRSTKPLTVPSFELPGEAISRRKREERDARLKAQAEEERKRREFKARPFRPNGVPSTLPRETATSRARQSIMESTQQSPSRQVGSKTLTRPSAGSSTGTPSFSRSSTTSRGRNSMAGGDGGLSRGTSASTKRSSVSIEDLAFQKLRAREILEQDNSFRREKEQTKQERESMAKSARDLAAERTRAASRDWAEKKRRKELALLEAMKAGSEQMTPE